MDNKIKKWIKGVGVLAFAFFFVKGLLWIGVIYFGYNWIADFGGSRDTCFQKNSRKYPR